MKGIIKKLSLFIVIFLFSILVHPSSIKALSEKTSFISKNDNFSVITVGDLSFSNIKFQDNSSTSSRNFGLIGTVTNRSQKTIDYNITIYYYDSKKHCLLKIII